MIPILYQASETTFASNGLGRLTDCISCIVTEERNGIYECEFTYPITGPMYSDIIEGRIISVTHDNNGDRQPFVIYRRSAPIDGIVTFNAHHISYRLSGVVVSPFTSNTASNVFTAFVSNAMNPLAFTFTTNIATSSSFSFEVPSSIKSLLGGVEGSLLDVFGGEYEFDKFQVKLLSARGADNGVTIRYGKNLTDIEHIIDMESCYGAVVPFWKSSDSSSVVYGGVVTGTGQTNEVVVPLDLTEDFAGEPTVAQLESRALSYINANTPWNADQNLEVDFVSLWQTSEYEDIAPLEKVLLCDLVTVSFPALGTNAKAKVITTEYDVLLERYNKIELGSARLSLADVILTQAQDQQITSLGVNGKVFQTPFEWNDGRTQATFTAKVYKNDEDITSSYPASKFQWYLRTESGDTRLGYGYTMTVTAQRLGYGGTVVGRFLDWSYKTLVDRNDNNYVDRSGNNLVARAL